MKTKLTLILVLLSSILFYCKTGKNTGTDLNNSSEKTSPKNFDTSPFIPADQSVRYMQVEEGFEVKLVASEPLVSTPVAMTFDDRGRIWVVEMNGYMPDIEANGEDIPNGKIVILEDKNGDGVADHRIVFLDSLVMPRALCLVEDGILVAEPSNLWFYEIRNDKPAKKTLVDPEYIVGGNAEHQPNGLYRALDNWIYSARSTKRYRRKNNQWITEHTHIRGQWGLTQDDHGRLYTNNNSQNLFADYFSPSLGAANANQPTIAGFGVNAINNNRVYPARPTPGVNRGYLPGILDDSLKLINFTAACGPLVYRGGLFGKDYALNAFVAEPGANLIKRNILKFDGYITKGQQAYDGKEFLTSTDERFRPVSLYDGPDGAMYIVDMHRGVLEHLTFLTPYLKDEIKKRNLELPVNAGRIYKIVPKGTKTKFPKLTGDADYLVSMLPSPNGWLRDYAQKTLIDRKLTEAVPALRKALSSPTLASVHALWTLEGLGALTANDLLPLLQSSASPDIRLQALTAIPSVISSDNYALFLKELEKILQENDQLSAPYIGFLTGVIRKYNPEAATALSKSLVSKYANNIYVADAVVSNLHNKEVDFQKDILKILPDTSLAIYRQLKATIKHGESLRANKDPALLAKLYPKGAALYSTICQTCHGADGNGVKSLAPPINKSEWVTGKKDRLIAVVLYGLTGPIRVNAQLYKAPEISGEMPGLGGDPSIPTEELAELLSYVRQSWQNNADKVQVDDIHLVRKKFQGREKPFTMHELERM